MNKKFFTGVMALSLMISGVLCGCNADKDTESEEKSSSSSSKSNSVSTDNEKEESSARDVSSKDKIYTDYLSQQKLCKISKNFKILEAGTARDNPNGLAGAVKHDFDGDKIDELVTFTFEKNSTNGEDIRIDLLKIDDGKAVVSDSKYLTDILDMDFLYPSQKGNTIYYSDLSELQIVQSEYNGQLYFGVLLKEADYLGGLSSFNTKYSVFTIKDNKIESEAVGAVINDAVFNISYARQIPPSISDMELSDTACIIDDKISQSPEMAEQEKTRIDEMTVDREKYNLFTDSHSFDGSYQIKGGAYESKSQAFSAMLNEFGLDIDDAYNQNHYNFVSKNQSEMKIIIQMEQIRPFDKSGVMEYLGTKLTLDSDLEELLGNDSPFKEPFADELALYEDILKYPYYYHEIWDNFVQNNYGTSYFVADIDQNGEKELVITGKLSNIVCNVTVVKHDLTVLSNEIGGGSDLRIYDNGVIAIFDTNPYANVYYLDSTTGESLVGTSNDGKRYIFGEGMQDEKYSGDEADAKEAELLSGARLITDFNYYDLYYPEILGKLVFIDDISKITYTWQKAYIEIIDELSGLSSEYTEAALLYIDDDDIPEIYIQNYSYRNAAFIYSYRNGEAYEMGDIGGLRMQIGGYKEKGSMYYSDFSDNAGSVEGHELYKVENGYGVFITAIRHDMVEDKYYIANDEVDEKTYNQKFEELKQGMDSTVKILTYDEIIERLHADS